MKKTKSEKLLNDRKLEIVKSLQKKLGKKSYAILTGNKNQNTVLEIFNLKESEVLIVKEKLDVDIFSARDIYPSTLVTNYTEEGSKKYIQWFNKYKYELNSILERDEQFFVLKDDITHYN